MALNIQALANYLAKNPKSLQSALSVTQFAGQKLNNPQQIMQFLKAHPNAANRMGKHLQRAVGNKDLGFGVDVTENNSTQNADRTFDAASAPGSGGTTGASGDPTGNTGGGTKATDLYNEGTLGDISGPKQKMGLKNSIVSEGIQSDLNAKEQAIQQGQYGGTQSVRKDEFGNVIVEKKLGEDQAAINAADTAISKGGRGIAQGYLESGAFNQAFNPNLTERTTTGDINKDRARIEDEVFARYTKDLDQNYDRDKQKLEAELVSRGVPLTPESVQYQRQMEELNKRYDNQRTDARQRAVEVGGQEFSRSFGIGEQLRGNQLNEQSQIRTQQVGETQAFAGMGPGVKEDTFNPYQAFQPNLPDPTEIESAKANIQQGKDTVDINKQNAATAAKTSAEQIALERERNQILKDQQAANDENDMIAARSLQTGPAPAPSQAEAQAMDVAAPAPAPKPVPVWSAATDAKGLANQRARIEGRIAGGTALDPAEAQRRLAAVKKAQRRL